MNIFVHVILFFEKLDNAKWVVNFIDIKISTHQIRNIGEITLVINLW